MKPQDILVLVKILIKGPIDVNMPRIAHELYMSKSEVYAAVKRLKSSELIRGSLTSEQPVPILAAMQEFLFYGLKYVFPGELGKEVRGIPTAFSAPPLLEEAISPGQEVIVWPYEFGKVRGQSLKPLYQSVPRAAEIDSKLYEFLVLIDGIRIGRTREVKQSMAKIAKCIEEKSLEYLNDY